MKKEDAVVKINSAVSGNAWFDFSVVEFQAGELTIYGGIDLSYFYQLAIKFSGVQGFHGPFVWKSDTSKSVIDLPSGEELRELNIKYDAEAGYQLFRFKAEDQKTPVIIFASECTVIDEEIHYG